MTPTVGPAWRHPIVLTVSLVLGGAPAATLAASPAGPDLLWAEASGGTGFDQPSAIAVDSDGSSLVAGYFQEIAVFGRDGPNETGLVSAGQEDAFIAKYDSLGTLQWVTQAGGPGTGLDRGTDIAVDADGNAVVTGAFSGTAKFGAGEQGGTSLEAAGGYTDAFVAKLDPEGALLWVRGAGGTGDDTGAAVAVDGDGNLYVTGSFQGVALFGAGETAETVLTSDGDFAFDAFLAKYDPFGTLIWARRIGAMTDNFDADVSVGADGSSVVFGSFQGLATFGEGEANETTLDAARGTAMFVAKYTPNGLLAWVKRAGAPLDKSYWNPGLVSPAAGALDKGGNSLVTGHMERKVVFGEGEPTEVTAFGGAGSLFVAKYAPDGSLLWTKRVNGNLYANDIAVDERGLSFVVGQFSGQLTIRVRGVWRTLRTQGRSDAFVVRYSPSGVPLDAWGTGGTGDKFLPSIAVDAAGDVLMSGSFDGTATFGAGTPGEISLESAGWTDIFVSRWKGTDLWRRRAPASRR